MHKIETEPGNHGSLGLWDAISIIVGIVIGTSIFKVPWLIFMNASDPWMGLLVWVFGGFLALVGGLCYAELATTLPRSGGDYVYLTRAYAPWLGFLFGWAQLAVVMTASIGAMAYVFAENATTLYDLRQVLDVGLSSEFLYSVLAVVVITLLNVIGVVMGKFTQNLLTLAKVVGLGAIIVAGLTAFQSSPTEWQIAERPSLGWGALAIILVLYAYGGWNDAAFVAAEVRDRQRNIPLALILGIGLITLVYLLVNAAYLVGLGFDAARQPGAQLPQLLLEGLIPGMGGRLITIIIMISALGAVNGLVFTGARIYASLGEDHPVFGWLGRWRPNRGAPVLSLLTQAVFAVAMLAALATQTGHESINLILTSIGILANQEWQPGSGFEALVSHSAPVFWVFFLLTGMALFILRDHYTAADRPFSVPFYPVTPMIFCAMCLYMLYQSVDYVGWRCLYAFALVLLGLPLYLLSRAMGGYRGEPGDAFKHPVAPASPGKGTEFYDRRP